MDVKEQHQILIRRRFAIFMKSDDIGGLQNCERKCYRKQTNISLRKSSLLHIGKHKLSIKQNVQNCCLTVSVAIPLRQNWCQGDGHMPWTDRNNPLIRGPPSPVAGRVGRRS